MRGFRDAVLAVQLCRPQASRGFLQEADDLFFTELLLHYRSSLEPVLHRHRAQCGEQITLVQYRFHDRVFSWVC